MDPNIGLDMSQHNTTTPCKDTVLTITTSSQALYIIQQKFLALVDAWVCKEALTPKIGQPGKAQGLLQEDISPGWHKELVKR